MHHPDQGPRGDVSHCKFRDFKLEVLILKGLVLGTLQLSVSKVTWVHTTVLYLKWLAIVFSSSCTTSHSISYDLIMCFTPCAPSGGNSSWRTVINAKVGGVRTADTSEELHKTMSPLVSGVGRLSRRPSSLSRVTVIITISLAFARVRRCGAICWLTRGKQVQRVGSGVLLRVGMEVYISAISPYAGLSSREHKQKAGRRARVSQLVMPFVSFHNSKVQKPKMWYFVRVIFRWQVIVQVEESNLATVNIQP
jgi:hypothetical protein